MAPPDAALIDALRRLPPTDLALLELAHRRGLSDTEIAAFLGLTPDALHSRRARLLERLAVDAGGDGELESAGRIETALSRLESEAWPGSHAGPETRGDLAERLRAAQGLLPPLLPGALTAYLGFSAGGFFPDGTAVAAVVVCLALVLRVTLAEHPAGGLGPLGGLAVGLLGAFAVWTLVSGSWSDAPSRALIEFDRALLYLLICVLFVAIPRSTRSVQVMVWGLAAAAVSICVAGLASRVLPGLLPTSPEVSSERLAYPVTYWNALGLVAALGVIACFHLAASEREPKSAQVLGAGAVPALAVTLYFSFSRGAIIVLAIGLLAYLLLGRPRALLSAVIATVPAAVVALIVAYGAEMLATTEATAPSAAGQADKVALACGVAVVVAALLRLALKPLDGRLSAVRIALRIRRTLLAAVGILTLMTAVGLSVTLDAPERLQRQYDRFVEGEVDSGGDARRRLTNPANNGRLDPWRVAVEVFREERAHGQGAGTYELAWARERPVDFVVIDAHSLYLETLAELGVVGLVLLAGALVVLMFGLIRRIRGPDRALHAAVFAMGSALLIRAGVDWDWEMPVATLWFFAVGGAALARPAGARRLLGEISRPVRVVTGLVLLSLAATPALIYLSEVRLDRSTDRFERGDCPGAVDEALASTSVLSVRPEPFEILAYCDVRLGRPGLAVRAMEAAVERDPDAWQFRYGLALVRGAAGRDPRPAARAALRLNPRNPLVRTAVNRFRTNDPQKWRRRALGARLPIG